MSDTLATFHLADLWCGIDVAAVHEVIVSPDIVAVPTAPPAVAGLFNLRGQVLAAIDLRRRLGLPTAAAEAGDQAGQVVYLVEHRRALVGLVVDRPGPVVPTPSTGLPVPATTAASIAAVVQECFELPDGLLLLLDRDQVLDSDDGRPR